MKFTELLALLMIHILATNTMAAVNPDCREVHVANKISSVSSVDVACKLTDGSNVGNRTIAENQEFSFPVCVKDVYVVCCVDAGPEKDTAVTFFNKGRADSPCTGQVCYAAFEEDGIYYSGQYPPTKDLIKQYSWESIGVVEKCTLP